VSGRMTATLPLPFAATSFRAVMAEKSLVSSVAEIEAVAPEPELALALELEPEDEFVGLLELLLLQPAMSRAAALATAGIATKEPLPDLGRARRAAEFMNTSRLTEN
jgi:hypothetical protein